MAERVPLVVAAGQVEQLQAGDTIAPSFAFQWASNANFNAAQFIRSWSAQAPSNAEDETTKVLVPGASTLKLRNARGQVGVAPGGATADVFTLRVNGVATSIVVTISGASTTGADTTNTATVIGGDVVTVQGSKTGAPTGAASVLVSVECSP